MVTSIAKVEKKPDPKVIACIEELLTRAKAGGILSIAAATVNSDLSSGNSYHSTYDPVCLIGELTVTIRELQDNTIDLRRHTAGEDY